MGPLRIIRKNLDGKAMRNIGIGDILVFFHFLEHAGIDLLRNHGGFFGEQGEKMGET